MWEYLWGVGRPEKPIGWRPSFSEYKYTKRIKMKKEKKIWFIIIGLFAITLLLIFFFPPKEISFKIVDRCGPIMNLISHTIQDKSVCETRCKSQCSTKDLEYSKIAFTLNPNTCNDCMCFCKEKRFK